MGCRMLCVGWGVVGVFGGCGCELVSPTGSGWEGGGWCVWLVFCWVLSVHALHCRRLSCEGFEVGRVVLMLLLIPVFRRFVCCGCTSVMVLVVGMGVSLGVCLELVV